MASPDIGLEPLAPQPLPRLPTRFRNHVVYYGWYIVLVAFIASMMFVLASDRRFGRQSDAFGTGSDRRSPPRR